jgi:hypothetical protein
MKRLLVLLILATFPVALHAQQVRASSVTFTAGAPALVKGATGSVSGNPGSITLYYWIAARYPSGLSLPAGPVHVVNTVGIANLSGTQFVVLSWQPASAATGYYVIRQAQPQFPQAGTCTSCVVAANQAGTTFSDQGGATTNWPPAGVPFSAAAEISLSVDNLNAAFPFLNIVGGTGSSVFGNSGPVNIGSAAAPVVMTTLTGSQQEIGARGTGSYGTLTSLKGADFRVTSTGGAGTFLVGTQSIATTGAGSVSVTELFGGNFVASHLTGTAVQMYGVVGELDVVAPATAAAGGVFATGVLGVLNDGVGVQNVTNHPSAVMGAIFDNNTAADAAVIAYVTTDNVRVNPIGAGFRVIDRTTGAGHGFNYGLDLYYTCAMGVCSGATELNSFNNADIRLSSEAEILTGTGVPAGGLCTATNLGAIYLNHGGGAGTSLYVCEAAGAWAGK